MTPDVTLKISKRRFVGLVRSWRRKLHQWDPNRDMNEKDICSDGEEDDAEMDTSTSGGLATPFTSFLSEENGGEDANTTTPTTLVVTHHPGLFR